MTRFDELLFECEKFSENVNSFIWKLKQIKEEHFKQKESKNVENETNIPSNYMDSSTFSREFLFSSNSTISSIISNMEIELITYKTKKYFDPIKVIEYILIKKPAVLYNRMIKLRDILPKLNTAVEEAKRNIARDAT